MKSVKILVLIAILFIFIPDLNIYAFSIPDTGQTKCYNNTVEIPCPSPGEPFYGQDAQYQGPTRSYTKLDQNGVALSDSTTQESGWVMTRDNVTGLVWEMKTDDDSIHDKDNTYTWCDRNQEPYSIERGTCGNETGSAATDTDAFIKELNNAQFGGFSNWRMPTIKELSLLVNRSIPSPGPTIDAHWFPNTVSSISYWSSDRCSDSGGNCAFLQNFSDGSLRYFGIAYNYPYMFSFCVRAVRTGQ